jgi:hypothetical protein
VAPEVLRRRSAPLNPAIRHSKNGENGKQQDAGMLGHERESCGQAAQNQPPRGGLLCVAIEGIYSGEETASLGQIRGYDRAVPQDRRLKYDR